jgi:hypothetical protein
MQWAHDIAAGPRARRVQVAAPFEHDRLAVATHIGDEFYALGSVNQRTTFAFLGQGMVIAQLGNGQAVPDIPRAMLEENLDFALVKRFVKITGDGKLARSLLQLKT